MKVELLSGGYATIDQEDWWYLKQYRWTRMPNGYIRAVKQINRKQYSVLLHRIIMNPPDNLVVDHINMDPSDNRKINLRICTRGQNNANCNSRRGTTSKYKGVSWQKRRKKWHGYYSNNGIKIHLGSFGSEIEAAKAYNEAAIKQFGEFARLNEFK